MASSDRLLMPYQTAFDAAGDAAVPASQVVGKYLEVLVAGVSECAATIHVTNCVDTRY